MTEYTKPTKIQNIWAASGDRSPAPDDTKIATGFVVEIPFLEDFNYLEHRQDSALAHINQRGICLWDSASDYLAAKSYAQGNNGIVYRAKLDHNGVDPVTDTNKINWEPAFYSQTEVYTKAETHTTFAQRTNNLSDLTNAATARTNLGGVVTGSEVSSAYLAKADNLASIVSPVTAFTNIKQTATEGASGVLPVATNSEVNAGAVTKTVTPLTLKDSYGISLNPTGYRKAPSWDSGFSQQWGSVYVSDNTLNQIVYLPVAFPVQLFQVTLGVQLTNTDDYAERAVVGWSPRDSSSFYITNARDGGGGLTVSWIAVGY